MPHTISAEGLLQYPPFGLLDKAVRAVLSQLVTLGHLNDKGRPKRPSNMFFIFRAQRLQEISAKTDEDIHGPQQQKDISKRISKEWHDLLDEAKAGYNIRYEQELEKFQSQFSFYNPSPVPQQQWNGLTKEGKKMFWFASAVQIATKVARPDTPWNGSLRIQSWIQQPGNGQYTKSQRYAVRMSSDVQMKNLSLTVSYSPSSNPSKQDASTPRSSRPSNQHNQTSVSNTTTRLGS
jgi:hypothetical protein